MLVESTAAMHIFHQECLQNKLVLQRCMMKLKRFLQMTGRFGTTKAVLGRAICNRDIHWCLLLLCLVVFFWCVGVCVHVRTVMWIYTQVYHGWTLALGRSVLHVPSAIWQLCRVLHQGLMLMLFSLEFRKLKASFWIVEANQIQRHDVTFMQLGKAGQMMCMFSILVVYKNKL